MTQPSQKLLVADLQAAGAHYLATRAAGGEFHDFKGRELPQQALADALDFAVSEKRGDDAKLRAIRDNVIAGKYDATKAESETCPDCGLPRGYEARCTSAWHDRPVADKTTELGAVEKAVAAHNEIERVTPSPLTAEERVEAILASLTPADLAPEGHVAVVLSIEAARARRARLSRIDPITYEAEEAAALDAALHDKGERRCGSAS